MSGVYDLNSVIITLDPTSEKRAVKTLQEVEKLGFIHTEFLIGVRGKDLPEETVKDMLTARAYYELKKGRCVHEAISSLGAIGCTLSHVEAWKRCVASGKPLAVFEDDFVASENASEILSVTYEDAVEHDFGVLRLVHFEIFHDVDPKKVTENITTGIFSNAGTGFYIITPDAAEAALKSVFPIDIQVDFYLNRLAYRGDFSQYFSTESLNDFMSLVTMSSEINHNTLKCQTTKTWISHVPMFLKNANQRLGKHMNCKFAYLFVFLLVLALVYWMVKRR